MGILDKLFRKKRCEPCGREIISHKQFCWIVQKELGLPVNPETGNVIGAPTLAPGSYVLGPEEQLAFHRLTQLENRYRELERKKGYICADCGDIYCFDCLFKHGEKARGGGKLCFRCKGKISRW